MLRQRLQASESWVDWLSTIFMISSSTSSVFSSCSTSIGSRESAADCLSAYRMIFPLLRLASANEPAVT